MDHPRCRDGQFLSSRIMERAETGPISRLTERKWPQGFPGTSLLDRMSEEMPSQKSSAKHKERIPKRWLGRSGRNCGGLSLGAGDEGPAKLLGVGEELGWTVVVRWVLA